MHPLIEKVQPYLVEDYRNHEFNIEQDDLINIIEDHKCVWKRRIDSTADKSIKLSVWKPSCSENSYIDNSGKFCRDCAGLIEIAE